MSNSEKGDRYILRKFISPVFNLASGVFFITRLHSFRLPANSFSKPSDGLQRSTKTGPRNNLEPVHESRRVFREIS